MDQDFRRAKQAYEAGRFEQAVRECEAILARDANDPEANHLLGLVLYRQGQDRNALTFLQRAVASGAGSGRMFSNLGAVLNALGDFAPAISAYRRAIELDPANPWPLNNLGVLYRNTGQNEAAIEAFRRALQLKPDLADAEANLRLLYTAIVPQWHFAMLNDAARNDAYEAAIRRAVRGKRVLEIGTGAGLLAMLAANAGAAAVDSCEAAGVIAREAEAIVARNGLSGRVRIIPKHSTGLVPGRDIARRAEVLITETFSSNLLDEGVLPALEDAHRRLLTQDATVIPMAASAMGFLIGGDSIGAMLRAGRIKGFEFLSFNAFAPPRLVIPLDGAAYQRQSADFELLRFDLRDREFPMLGRQVQMPVTSSGICHGVALWIQLDLDSQTRYSNRPGSGVGSHWPNIIYRFVQPVRVAAGDMLQVFVRHDRAEISISLAA